MTYETRADLTEKHADNDVSAPVKTYEFAARVAEKEILPDGNSVWYVFGIDREEAIRAEFLFTSLVNENERSDHCDRGTSAVNPILGSRDLAVVPGVDVFDAVKTVLKLTEKNSKLDVEMKLVKHDGRRGAWSIKRLTVTSKATGQSACYHAD